MAEIAHIPADWQRQSWPAEEEFKRTALVELGLLEPASRTALFETPGVTACPLLQDDRQPHLAAEGPWLFEVTFESMAELSAQDKLGCGLQAWIESRMAISRLAGQLAPAMVAYPAGEPPALLRFYLSRVIRQLHAETQADWHRSLFGGIEQWWQRGDDRGWQALGAMPVQEPLESPWQLTLSSSLYQALHGDPEVRTATRLLTQQHPDLFAGVCACARSQRVEAALLAATEAGLVHRSERLAYVYRRLLDQVR
ncbi:DUF4123 domain-containing protein [Halomonas heilongjiangensis]|uniref:DUF4123 domain-containing protein n=1 Tax=Halomonas heilongjiangensis TaxID=1387883 RepID=A0A2N7TGF1_9GAMM|nr:DUF4123 domain-containing protein [Halomonas heilongjiangensis]PMR67271.1 hypothetical protein C1H66_20315 [Halomonas heilongjiangensis]PXX92228.1 hypothetical protein CR158_06105 [Halomonas heilongjiangensis]